MTFKKKTPDLITLFFHSPVDDREVAVPSDGTNLTPARTGPHKRTFRVAKRELFIQTLQVSTLIQLKMLLILCRLEKYDAIQVNCFAIPFDTHTPFSP